MASTAIPTDRLDALAATIHGEVIAPEDPGYDDARAVWNGMIDRHPAAIARVRGVADVQDALAFARETGLDVSVHGGGHNVAGSAICEGGLVVDCSELTAVRVDPDRRTAWVQSGATWADVDRETQAFGLAVPGGVVSKTGVAGLTLGGGIGHLRCAHGLSCDNLRAVELVTPDGEYVVATREDHPDLFWGLRGGGGGFGVVTAFEFDCHPVGPEVAMSLTFYDADDLPEVLRNYRAYVADAPDSVSSLTFAGQLPEEAVFEGEALHRNKIAVLGCHAGADLEVGQAALAPLRELSTPMADESGVLPYADLQRLLDADYPDGMRYYWNSLFLDDLSDSAIERIDYWTEVAPSPLSTVDVWELGGAIERVDPGESAFAGRHAPYLLGVEANWEEPETDDANVDWVRDCVADMRQFSDGSVYLNFPGFYEGGEATMETTFGSAYERLTTLRETFDPEGLFRPNEAIASAEGGEVAGGR